MLRKRTILFFLLLLLFFIMAIRGSMDSPHCSVLQAIEETAGEQNSTQEETEAKASCKVTFIELGSVKCIPCKMMQPIMEEIEEEYPDVQVVFYDVWTADGQKYGQKYKIRVIPTQVFLDKDGNEYFRHEGFFPKEDLEKVLVQGGVSKKEK